MRRIIHILVAALCLGSCVYPYDDFVVRKTGNLVVEGDIVVGGLSYFLPTRMQSLNDLDTYEFVKSDIWVESGDGSIYGSYFKDTDYGYVVDLTGADPSQEYRLRIDTPDGKRFASQWEKVGGKVEIDGLKYQKDTVGGVLNIQVGLHSDGSSHHFRYRFVEDWEYTAYAHAYVYYDIAKNTVQRFEGSFNTYYCWKTGMSRGLNLATTEKLSEDRLVDYTFKTIASNDERLSVMYRIKLEVYPVSAASYAYYENVRDISSPTGDLFSPMPSEVRGNIRNMDDESEMVYGMVAVVCPNSATLYYDNEVGKFYHNTERVEYEEVSVDAGQYLKYYLNNYRPVRIDPMEGTIWAPARCVDCRLKGGTKNKPEDWPTSSI